MKNTQKKLYNMVLLALFVAIELMMYMMGLGLVPIGPLKMSFLMIPIAVGAMLLGPWQGALLGAVFGLCSLWDAYSGASAMTGFFFHNVSKLHTVVLCVGTRMLMGLLTGLIFQGLRKVEKRILPYYGAALAAPLLNTLLFMGYIVLVFYQTEYIQNLAAQKGAGNALIFVVLMVGIQGLVELVSCTFVAGTVGKAVSHAIKKQ